LKPERLRRHKTGAVGGVKIGRRWGKNYVRLTESWGTPETSQKAINRPKCFSQKKQGNLRGREGETEGPNTYHIEPSEWSSFNVYCHTSAARRRAEKERGKWGERVLPPRDLFQTKLMKINGL